MGAFVDTSMKSKVLFIDALNKKPRMWIGTYGGVNRSGKRSIK